MKINKRLTVEKVVDIFLAGGNVKFTTGYGQKRRFS